MDRDALFIDIILRSWHIQVKNTNKFFDEISDEGLLYEVAPGRNRVIYIFGHLIAVHDNMLPLLGMGERLFPHLDDVFLKSPDKSGHPMPSPDELHANWKQVNEVLAEKFSHLSPTEWLERHTAVSAEAFEKEPTRNKINVLISRTSHLAYHLGQLILVKGVVKD